MPKYSMVIADADSTFAEELSEYMNQKSDLNVVGNASDGISALNLIRSVRPDIVLIDPLLPEMDGISLIKALQKLKTKPVIVSISRFYTPAMIEMARNAGADYYVYKPIAPHSLATVLLECTKMVLQERETNACQHSDENHDLMRRINVILRDLGFSSKHNGSRYIAASVLLASESPLTIHNMSSGLYRQISEQMHVSVASIERSMRTAISYANTNGRLAEKIGQIPTNKTCIRYILREINTNN